MAKIYDLIKCLPDNMQFKDISGKSIKYVTVAKIKLEHNNSTSCCYCMDKEPKYNGGTRLIIYFPSNTKKGIFKQVLYRQV